MSSYLELRERHQAEVNAFPMRWAFNDAQFKKGMRELGLKPTDTDKVVGIGMNGGFIRISDKQTLLDMFSRHKHERENALASDKDGSGYAYEMFRYEFANHEYAYTRDVRDTLDALCYSIEDIHANPILLKAFLAAKRDYLEEAEAKGWG